MSLLWRSALRREGMSWETKPGEEHFAKGVKGVKDVGFAGHVDFHPDTVWNRFGVDWPKEDHPDISDDKLGNFVNEQDHFDNDLWNTRGSFGHVSLKRPVFATQSHVSQGHLDKYHADPKADAHSVQQYGPSSYLGDDHPMFVTHQGRLHVVEGHHRVAAALQRGDHSIEGWHYDADKHQFPADNPLPPKPFGRGTTFVNPNFKPQ